MRAVRYQRRPHPARDVVFHYTGARSPLLVWSHVAYFLIVILSVFAVTVVFGFWSPVS